MRVLITGGCGKCGTALTRLECDKVFMDRIEPADLLKGEDFVHGNIRNPELLFKVAQGCDAVVHLAYEYPTGLVSPEDSLFENTRMMMTVLKTASYLGIKRVIYASSNHVVGMYEKENAPEIYEMGQSIRVDKHSPVRPDSLYAVNKIFCEDMGRYYAENGGPKFYALRIGSLFNAEEDHPYTYAERGVNEGTWARDSSEYTFFEKRLKSLWLSRRDFMQMVECCLELDGPRFDIFYGVSDNPRCWLDIEDARAVLGYKPLDSGESWKAPPSKDVPATAPGNPLDGDRRASVDKMNLLKCR